MRAGLPGNSRRGTGAIVRVEDSSERSGIGRAGNASAFAFRYVLDGGVREFVLLEFNEGAGTGFGWDRRSGQIFRTLPAPPSSTREEFGARALLAVTIEAGGRPAGRVLLVNPNGSSAASGSSASGATGTTGGTAALNGAGGPHRRFTRGDLRWLERIVRHVGPPLENVFLMRHLRARAVESERSRISRDLHDGILQTLLSLNIQLDVLRHKFPWAPEQAGQELETLQKTIQQESEELRRMVTDLRPLRVESADMRELM